MKKLCEHKPPVTSCKSTNWTAVYFDKNDVKRQTELVLGPKSLPEILDLSEAKKDVLWLPLTELPGAPESYYKQMIVSCF